jgi:uncharacterized protein (TIGR04255 family)
LEEKAPAKLQRVLRKDYPHFAKLRGVSMGDAGAAPLPHKYEFESKKRDWTIALSSNSLSLETKRYTDFEAFLDRFNKMLSATKELLDTDFFTRVGLRYINGVPLEDGTVEGWIRPDLVATILGGELGTLSKYHTELHGFIDGGQYSFRHGVKPRDDLTRPVDEYYLDFDYYAEDVGIDNVSDLITQFHDTNFSLFSWSLGEKAKERLGAGEPKERR